LRPALDLLRALPPLPNGLEFPGSTVIDLGCGAGAAGPAVAMLGRPVIGVDSSPGMNNAPSHRLWRCLSRQLFGTVPADGPGILTPQAYHGLLAPLGNLALWQTEYFQTLAASPQGHPIRRFTESTYGKPVLDALPCAKRSALVAAYDTEINALYPRAADGSVQFPFRRLFFTLTR